MREIIYNAPQELLNVITLIAGIPNFIIAATNFLKNFKKEKQKLEKSFWIPFVTGILIITLYALLAFLKGNMCRVPDVRGWTYYNAVQTLNERNIPYEFVSDEFDKNYAEISYQSHNNNSLIYTWEKLVLGVTSINDSLSTQTTTSEIEKTSPVTFETPVTEITTDITTTSTQSDIFVDKPKATITSLVSEIQANLDSTLLTATINKSLNVISENQGSFPFRWGFHLASSRDKQIGDKFIEVEICIDKNYSVIDVESSILSIEENGYTVVEKLKNEFIGTFNGEEFTITGDISNDYIDLSNLYIVSSYFCS